MIIEKMNLLQKNNYKDSQLKSFKEHYSNSFFREIFILFTANNPLTFIMSIWKNILKNVIYFVICYYII